MSFRAASGDAHILELGDERIDVLDLDPGLAHGRFGNLVGLQARGDVDAAARDAARAAVNARSAAQAIDAGNDAARVALVEGGVTCRSLAVEIDTSAFRAGGVVRATVACTVELESLTGVALPGSRTVTSSFLAPVDQFRGIG